MHALWHRVQRAFLRSQKIRHVFGNTLLTEQSIGAGPPVIIQLSGFCMHVFSSTLLVSTTVPLGIIHQSKRRCNIPRAREEHLPFAIFPRDGHLLQVKKT